MIPYSRSAINQPRSLGHIFSFSIRVNKKNPPHRERIRKKIEVDKAQPLTSFLPAFAEVCSREGAGKSKERQRPANNVHPVYKVCRAEEEDCPEALVAGIICDESTSGYRHTAAADKGTGTTHNRASRKIVRIVFLSQRKSSFPTPFA